MDNRVFIPQDQLDRWIVDGTADLQQEELTIVSEGRRYRVAEAVRVLRDVSGTGDPHELIDRVKTRVYLEQLGAEIVETSMLLGDTAYDVEPGWIGVPVGRLADHRKAARDSAPQAQGTSDPKTDEELLASLVKRP